MAKTLIRKVKIVDQNAHLAQEHQCILVEDGLITYIGKEEPTLDSSIDQVLSSENLYVSAGWFDMRCFVPEPGFEHRENFESASLAASRGGFTGLLNMPCSHPLPENKSILKFVQTQTQHLITGFESAASLSHHGKGEELTEILDLQQAGALAFTDGNKCISHTGLMLRALQYVQPFDGLIIQHAEDQEIMRYGQMHEGDMSTYLGLKGIPSLAEKVILDRDISLLQYTGGRIHFGHVSSKEAVESIRLAKKQGLRVTADVSAAHLYFTDERLLSLDAKFKLSPPLRTESDRLALWEGLEDGTLDAVVSDHTPWDEESKHLEFDLAEFGGTGLETAFAGAWSAQHKLPLQTLLSSLFLAPRKILGLPIPKIQVGQMANLTVFDPNISWTYHGSNGLSKSRFSPFDGATLQGKVLAVFNKHQSWIA